MGVTDNPKARSTPPTGSRADASLSGEAAAATAATQIFDRAEAEEEEEDFSTELRVEEFELSGAGGESEIGAGWEAEGAEPRLLGGGCVLELERPPSQGGGGSLESLGVAIEGE